MAQAKHDEATRAFLRAVQISPDELVGYQLLASTFDQSTNFFDAAISRFEQYYRRHAKNSWSTYLHARARSKAAERGRSTGGMAECVDLLEGLVRWHPDFFEAHLLLGGIYFSQKRWQASVEALEKALALKPDHIEGRYKLGLALQRSGQTERARAELVRYQEQKARADSDVAARVAQTIRFIVELK